MADEAFPHDNSSSAFDKIIGANFDIPPEDRMFEIVMNQVNALKTIEYMVEEGIDIDYFSQVTEDNPKERDVFSVVGRQVIAELKSGNADARRQEELLRLGSQAKWLRKITRLVPNSTENGLVDEDMLIDLVPPYYTKRDMQIDIQGEKSLSREWKDALHMTLDRLVSGESIASFTEEVKRQITEKNHMEEAARKIARRYQDIARPVIEEALSAYRDHDYFPLAVSYLARAAVERYSPIQKDEMKVLDRKVLELHLVYLGLHIEDPLIQEALDNALEVLQKS